MSSDYDVGYGKPPKSTRFKKGQSGNRKGRPRGSLNLKTDLEEELQERVTVSERGRKRQFTKQRALLRTWMNKALQGDHRAFVNIIRIALQIIDPAAQLNSEAKLSATDEAIIARFLGREGSGSEEGRGLTDG
jgi:hypothetical protein